MNNTGNAAIRQWLKRPDDDLDGAEALEILAIANSLYANGHLTQKGNREYQELKEWLIETIDAGIEATPRSLPEAGWVCPECGSKRLHRTGHCIVDMKETADENGDVADYETGDWEGYIGTLKCECRDCGHTWTLEL